MKRFIGPIAAIVIFVTLVGLGFWQVDRGAWKQTIIAAADAGLAAAPVPLTTPPGDDRAWQRVETAGTWVADGLVRIKPAILNGNVGADYAAPFRLADGGFIVVEIGWAPDSAAAPTLDDGPQRLIGALKPAPKANMFRPDNIPDYQWIWLEPTAILAAAGLTDAEASPLVLRLSAPPEGLIARPARPNFTDNHLQYALTWFGLAAVWAVIAFLQLRGRRKRAG